MAIKVPKNGSKMEVNEFLEEVKSMIEIKAYHDNIVNLQGITYKRASCMDNDVVDGIEVIEVNLLRNHIILMNTTYYITEV